MNNIRVVRAPKNRIVRDGEVTRVSLKAGDLSHRYTRGVPYKVLRTIQGYYEIVDDFGHQRFTDPSRWDVVERTTIGYVAVKFDDAFRIAGLEAGGEYPVQAELKDHVDLKLISGRVLRVKKKRVTAIHSNPQAATDEYLSWKANRQRVAYQQREAEAKRKAAEKARDDKAAEAKKIATEYASIVAKQIVHGNWPAFRVFPKHLQLADLFKSDHQPVPQLMPVAKPMALTINIPEGKTSVTITHGVHGETHLAFA